MEKAEHNSYHDYCFPPSPPALTNTSVKCETPSSNAGNLTSRYELASKTHVNEPPITAAEIEEQNNKSFQLSTMLKDATPQILEASVDASVELLDSLKAPLLEKMANSPDAEQWISRLIC